MSESTKKTELQRQLEPLLDQQGCELVLMEYRKEGPDWVLRLFVDHSEGITLQRCEQISHSVSEFLDEQDLIPHAYNLEVSSPGIDRPLVKPAHFLQFLNHRVMIKTMTSVEGTKSVIGPLVAADQDGVSVLHEADHKQRRIPFDLITKATLKPVLDFS